MHNVYGWSLVGVICMFGIASAQVRPTPRPAAGAPAANVQGTSDQQLAAALHDCARNEVDLGKFAQKHAKSDDVKDFAAMVIKDHSPQVDKMGKWAGNLVAARSDERREVRKPVADEERGEDRPGDRPAAATAGQRQFSWVTIHQELANQCLKTVKDELGKKEGDDFDRCFIGQQIGAHLMAIDELKVFKNHASPQLQQDIEEAIDTAEGHLKDARKIMEQLEGSKKSRSSDREEK